MSELKNILNFESSETLFDLYCGTGLFSIYFSSFVKSVCGIELNPSGIRLAQKTAEINNIKNCKFFEGNVSESFVEIFNRYKTGRDIIMLDPPRAGLSKEMTKFLTETKINKLAYVSCEPSRLSRDLNILCNNGYHITDIFIADMFPQTMHMETIAVLSNNH
jgi:23S rRNA (uracil1939-C5)-methyltransferase